MQARHALWLADALTFARVPLAILVALSLAHPVLAAALIAVAGLTDTADGRVARWARAHGASGTAGAWLDPVADKVFVAIVVGAVLARTGAWLAVALIVARDLLIVPLALAYRGRVRIQARPLGKLATDVQFIAIGVLVVFPAHVMPFAIATAVLGLVAVADYVRSAR